MGYTLPNNEETLPHYLNRAGYRCGLVGKAHFEPELNGHIQNLPADQPYYGFQDFHITEDIQSGEYLDWVQREYPQFMDEVRRIAHEDIAGTWGVELSAESLLYN